MLSDFDWLRRAKTGTELLATLKYLEIKHKLPDAEEGSIGPPPSALRGPCSRCWIYPPCENKDNYCIFCKNIIDLSKGLGSISRRSAVLWGYLEHLPAYLIEEKLKRHNNILGLYLQGKNRFLLMLEKKGLKPLLQEIAIRHGPEMKGLIQIFPTMGSGAETGMGDIICRAIHHETNVAMNQLWIRFYSSPIQLTNPRQREEKGMLTFEMSEFLALLETAEVFRSLLKPDEQDALYEILYKDDPREQSFYWGRFLGQLNMEARDMITSWGVRQWPWNRIQLIYELIDYVAFR